MKIFVWFFVALTVLLSLSCSGENEETNSDSLLKTQMDALEKAEEVEGIILDSAQQRKNVLEEQSQ